MQIDLQTGVLKWQAVYNSDNVVPNGPAVDGGKVFVETDEQTVAALDVNTGAEVWSKQVAAVDTQGIDQQIAAHDGTLYVSTVPGRSQQTFYSGGGMGIIYALDEQTGDVKWSFNTIKDGDLWGHPDVNSVSAVTRSQKSTPRRHSKRCAAELGVRRLGCLFKLELLGS